MLWVSQSAGGGAAFFAASIALSTSFLMSCSQPPPPPPNHPLLPCSCVGQCPPPLPALTWLNHDRCSRSTQSPNDEEQMNQGRQGNPFLNVLRMMFNHRNSLH